MGQSVAIVGVLGQSSLLKRRNGPSSEHFGLVDFLLRRALHFVEPERLVILSVHCVLGRVAGASHLCLQVSLVHYFLKAGRNVLITPFQSGVHLVQRNKVVKLLN